MRIKYPEKQDARGWKDMLGYAGAFIDMDTGQHIGRIEIHQGGWFGGDRSYTRSVSLLGGKYQADFDTHEECCAFADGVVAVINHVAAPRAENVDG
jgi:hypothetical protein